MANDPRSSRLKETAADNSVVETARIWVVRDDRGLRPAEAQAFAEWTAADPLHAVEFSRAKSEWGRLGQAGATGELDALADDIHAQALSRRSRRKIAPWAGGLLAAAAVIALMWAGGRQSLDWVPPSSPVTPPSNARVLTSNARRMPLPDGSVAELNGDSQLVVEFTSTERRLKLVQGEALFTVTKDPHRPFLVSAGPMTVRAVGTAFNVRLTDKVIEVLVTHGEVRMENSRSAQAPRASAGLTDTPTLFAGNRAIVEIEAGEPKTVTVDLPTVAERENALAWQSTQLVFDATRLADVLSTFNRLNSNRLILDDPALNDLKLTGVFRADNLEGFLRLLGESQNVVTVRQSENETVLRSTK